MGSKFTKTLLFIGLILCFLFLVIARVPATWGAWAVHQAAPDVWLTGVSGTLWQGRASGGTVLLGGKAIPVEDLRWRLQPGALLGFRACAEVQARVLDQPASGVFCGTTGEQLIARDVQLNVPMAFVSQWLDPDFAGVASVQLENLRTQGQRVQALQGNLSWPDARWHDGERWVSLGTFAASLQENDNGGIHAEIFDLDGPFKLQLTGDFVLHQEPVIKGHVTASEQAPQQIRELLVFIGEPMDDGSVRIAWPPGS